MSRITDILEEMDEDTLTYVERILELVYMSETGQCKGADIPLEYLFTNCTVKVLFGGNNGKTKIS